MAGLSFTKKYHNLEESIYEHYIKIEDIGCKTFLTENMSKIINLDGLIVTTIEKHSEFVILQYEPILILNRYHVLIAVDNIEVGYILVTNIRKPVITKSRQFNKGDIMEGILVATLVTKLLFSQLPTIDSIKNTISSYTISESGLTFSSEIVSSNIALKTISLENLINTESHGVLENEYQSAIKFASSDYISQFDNVPVIIESVGSLMEKSSKADIIIKTEHSESFISLKCGSTKNLEQVGVLPNSINNLITKLGVLDSYPVIEYEKTEQWYSVLFSNIVSCFNDKPIAIRKQNLVVMIIESATKNFPDLIQLHLHNTGYSMYSFGNLSEQLNPYSVIAELDTSKKRPCISFGTECGGKLITIRLEVRAGEVIYKIHIEKEKLLNDLTMVTI